MTAKQPPKKAPAKVGAAPAETSEQMRGRKRAMVQKRKKVEQEWLENNVAGSGRLWGRPSLYVRPVWELDEHQRARFLQSRSITSMFDQIRHKVHQDDHDLVTNALAATVGFHELSRLIESLEWDSSSYELISDLEQIRVGFELALQVLDKTLSERGIVLDARSRGGRNKTAPEWHAECVRLANSYLSAGTAKHEVAGKLAQRLGRDRTSITRVLKKAGIK